MVQKKSLDGFALDMEMIASGERGLLARRWLLLWPCIQRENVVPILVYPGGQAECGEKDPQEEQVNALMSDRRGGWRRKWRDDRSLRSNQASLRCRTFRGGLRGPAWDCQRNVDTA